MLFYSSVRLPSRAGCPRSKRRTHRKDTMFPVYCPTEGEGINSGGVLNAGRRRIAGSIPSNPHMSPIRDFDRRLL